MTTVICTTDEYAINIFKSPCRIQIAEAIREPTRLIPIYPEINMFDFTKGRNRSKPYDPNFNNTPANTIDPPTGASTCALGNQVWKRYIGVLTRNLKVIGMVMREEDAKVWTSLMI